MESGNLKNVYIRRDAPEGGEDIPLSELQREQQQDDSPRLESKSLSPAGAATSETAYERSASFSGEHAVISSPASGERPEGSEVNKQGAAFDAAAQQEEDLPAWSDANAEGGC